MEKKEYVKPEVIAQRDIEAITGACLTGGADSGQDKLMADPNTSMCLNPMT